MRARAGGRLGGLDILLHCARIDGPDKLQLRECVRAWLTGWMGLIMGRGWEDSGVHELNRKEST